ncbi:Anhydro-N-acetylmuramic acid kinase [Candidatus Entotheonellaceae bacterium PAL068K]
MRLTIGTICLTMVAHVTRVIGLMSGTSADGVDAALIDIEGQGVALGVRVLAHATYPYAPALREQILAASYPESSSVDLICHLNFALGACFADAAVALAHTAGIPLDQIDLIGSHGQTIYHLPLASTSPPRQVSTLQIGEPCVIAERTGITTVADFRPRDMAAGGIGAPLSPYGHFILFADPQRPKVVQNIGGIANVTVLTRPTVTDLLAFDTGPGNMLIDEAVRHFTDGRQDYDVDGQMAAQGRVHEGLLAELLQHPFITAPPPKATGREDFGRHLFCQILQRAVTLGLPPEDVVRTCTALTATSIRLNYQRAIFPHWAITEMVVCGGGAHNPVLMQMLRQRLPSCTVTTPEDYHYPNEALEAMLFALLAHATLNAWPTNIPRTTGARRPVVLGKIVPGVRPG